MLASDANLLTLKGGELHGRIIYQRTRNRSG